MAGGNLGDLWFQLGIRQNVSQQLDKVMSSLNLTDKEANALLHTLQGLGNKELGISKQSAKNAGTFADVLNKINKRYVELSRNEKTQDKAKTLLENTKNALSYLGALQRIAGAQHSLENLKSLNPNVDTSKLKEASGWLEVLKKQMLNLQSYGGVDNAKVIGFYSQAVSATLRDVAKVTSSFKKENPLSVLSGNAAKVETDLSRVTEKFAKLNDLMAEGARKGYNTSMLTSSFAELNSVLARLQSAQGNNSLLSDAAQMKNLFSDVQVAVNKAGDAMSAYGREKGKVIAAEKEHQAELSKAEKKANEKAAADRKFTLGLAEMEAWLKRIDALSAKGIKLGADTSKMDEMRSKIEALSNTFNQFRGTNAGLLGVDGNPSIEKLINDLRKLSKEYGTAREAQRELNSEQNKANKKADRDKKDSGRKYEQEAVNAAKLRDILSDIQKYQLRLAGASAGNDASQTASAAAKLQELINLYRQLELIQRHGTKYGENWVGKELQKTNFSTIAKEFNDMCAALERLHTVKGFSFSPATDFDSSAKEKLRAYREEILSLVDDLRSLKKGMHASDIRETKEHIAGLKRELARLNVDKNFSKGSMFEFKVIQKRLAGEERHLARLESFSNSEAPKLEQRLQEVWGKANAIKQTIGSPIKDQGVLNSIASQEYAAKKAAQEEVRAQEQVGNAIDAVKKRYRELAEVFYQMKTERSAMSKLGLDTSEIDAAIVRVVNGIKELRGVLHGLQNSKETFTSRVTLGDGSGIKGTSDRAIQNYKELNRAKQEAIDKERKHRKEVAATAAKVRNDLAAAFRQANQHAGQMNGTLQDLKNLFLQGGLVYGVKQMFDSIVQTGGEIEQQHIALRSILGDVAAADKMFAQTQQLALQSPFKFGELNRDVKQLAAFGVEANDLYDTTKRLADIASGLGVSFERLGLAYGQVKARAWLDGKELRQFAYAGLPMLQKVTDLYNKEGKNGRNNYTTSEVKKMISAREVSFEDVQKVLWQLTDEGGQFYNMQLVLSETLLGRWNKLIDAWDIMLGKFADGKNVVGGTFKFFIDLVTDLVLAMDKLSPMMLSLGGAYLGKRLISGGANMLTNAMGLGNLQAQYAALSKSQLQQYALTQQRAVAEGKITQQVATQNVMKQAYNLADRQSVANAMAQRAIMGNMTLLQMQRAYREGLINSELVEQLQMMGLISAKQSELIMKEGKLARVRLAGQQMAGKFGGIFTTANAWMVGIGVAISGALSIIQKMQEVDQRTKDIRKSAQQHMSTYGEALKGASEANLNNPQEIQNTNDELKGVLENSGKYTETIKEQVENTVSLTKQYEILKKAVENAKNAAKNEDKYSEAISEAFANTGGESNHWYNFNPLFFLNDDIAENTSDVETAFNKMQTVLTGFDEATRQTMNSVANEFLKPEQASLSLEEKLLLLAADSDTYEKFARKVAAGNNGLGYSLFRLEDDLEDVTNGFSEIAEDDIPAIIDSLASSLNMNSDGFKSWARKNVTTFDSMFTKILELCNTNTPAIVKKLRSIMYEALNMQDPQAPSGSTTTKPKTWKNPLKQGGAGRFAFDKLFEKGIVGPTLGGKTKYYQKAMAQYLAPLDAMEFETFGENVQKRYKKVRNENDAKKAAGKTYSDAELKMLETIANTMGITLDVGKNKVTGNFGKDKEKDREEDKELKFWKERLSSAKAFYQMYEKYKDVLGPDAALKETKNMFPDVPDMDVHDYEGSLRNMLSKLGDGWFSKSPERKKFKTDIEKAVKEWHLEEVVKVEAEQAAAAFTEALEQAISQWDLYKSLFEKTGSKDFASQAFKDGAVWNDLTKGLAAEFKAMTGEDVDIDATDAVAKEHLKDNKEAYELWKKIVSLVKGDYKKSLEESAEVWSRYETVAEKIASINDRYNRIVTEARRRNDGTSAETIRRAEKGRRKETTDAIYGGFEELKPLTERLKDIADKYAELINYARKTGNNDLLQKAEGARAAAVNDALWSDFNKQTGIEGSVANIESIGYAAAKALSETIEDWLGKQDLSSELADKLVGFQQKVKNYEYGRGNIFAGMRGLSQGNAISKYLSGGLGDMTTRVDASGVTRYVLNSAQAKKTGLTEGGAGYTQGELEDAAKEGKNAFNTSLSSLADKFKALQDCLSPVIDLFDALGMEDTALGVATNATSNALGAASSVASGLSSMGLSSMGPYGAAAAAALSITSSLLAMHDKALQKEIDASKEREEVEKNLYDNIKSTLDSLLGGVYTFKLNDSMKSALSSVVSGYESGKEDWRTKLLRAITGDVNANVSYYSDDTYEHSKAALADTNNAYIGQLAALEAQRDELQHQRDLEADKKKSDSSALIQYDQQIVEAEQAVRDFADEFAEAIYGIDLKDWASQLTDAIIEAWAAGEDAIDAYGDKAKELIKSLTSSIVSQMVLEPALKKVQDYYTKKLEETGKLTKEDIPAIGDMIMDTVETSSDQIQSILDYLKEQGYDLSENSSSSTSKSIKSITEETADLLASYINAIRLDCSVTRTNVQAILESVKTLPNISAIAQSQLTQLNQLVSLASARNDKLDTMYDWMQKVTNGTKKLYVA